MEKLNDRIKQDKDLGAEYQIGHSYFTPTKMDVSYDQNW